MLRRKAPGNELNGGGRQRESIRALLEAKRAQPVSNCARVEHGRAFHSPALSHSLLDANQSSPGTTKNIPIAETTTRGEIPRRSSASPVR